MAGFWDDYLARKRKQEEEEEERKRTAEAETEEDGEGGSLSFWAGYQRQKRTGESAPVPVEEEESLSLTDRLAQRGIAVDPVARHGTSAQGQTAAPADTSRTLAALTGNGKTGANLFTDRIGNTFTAARAQRDKLAAQAEEERKDQTVRNQDWLDALRTPEEIQAELDEENAKVKEYDRQAFKNNALGVWRDLIGQNAKTDAENQRISAERKAHDERKAALEDELAEAQWAGYERLRNNSDFEVKSQYKSTANGQETKKNPNGGYDSVGFDDVEYEYVNGNQDAATILANESREAGEANGILGVFVKPKEYEYTQLGEMSDEEKSLYNYIHATKGKQAAHEYLEYLRSDLYARQAEKEKNEAAVYAEEHPVLSTVRTVGTSPLRGVGYLGQAAQYLTEGTVDANAPYNRFSYLTSAERETVTRTVERNWGKAGSFAYGVGVSMAEFLLNSGISGGNEALSLALMGAGAASDATIEAKERGLADWQSFALGTIAGAAEIITEKVSIEKLFSDPGGRPWKYLLQNIFAEGSEEAASDVINLVADVLITQDKSEWMQSVRDYQKNNPGMSEDEAFVQVMKDQGLQILYDAAAGAASGGIMALPGSLRAFAQLSQDRSQRIEAGRQAIQAKRIQAQESGGGIVLPTADNTSETGDVIRTGAESDSTNPLRTVDEAEVDERVAKARNITEATGIRYGVDQKEIRRAERLGRMTGQEVEFYSHEAENGIVENGHMDPVTGKIWLNAKGKNPLQVTLGHEFTHSLEGTDAYRDLVDLAKTQTAESGGDWAAKADRYARLYEAHGDRVSAEMLDQELTADFVGETLFTDERAIREMFRENPSLGKQVRDAIDNFIVRASDMGGIMSPVDEQKFKNVLKIYDRYVRAAEVDRRSTPEVPAKREASMDREETAQEAREDAQAVDAVQEGNRQAEVPIAQETTRAAQLRARPWRTGKQTAGEQILSGNGQAAQGNAQQAETVSGMIVPESGEESPAEYRARMDALYDAGEITGEEYDEAMALADEAESTGRGFSSSTVERDEGPRGKLAEIADRLRGRYSLSEEERQDRGDPDIRRSLSEDSTSIISRPLSEYPIEKQKQIQQYIDAVDDSVLKFVNETRQKKKRYPFSIVTGIVSDELASRIRDITGVDMTGKEVRLRRNSIEHVDNRHTSKKADVINIADQMMEDPRDIARAQYVLDNFDNVEKGKWRSRDIMNSDNTGAQTVVVSKKIDGTYYVIEAVPNAKDKRLEIVSAHIKGDGSVADANAPSPTSITTVPQSPESSISDSGTDVNGGEKRFSLSPEKRIGEGPGDDTDSWYFKNWFGDYVNDPENASKVVNPDGTPKRMYHGTNADKEFTMFDTYGANYGLYGAGSYFTDNPEVAQSYTSKGRGKNPRVYEVYLNIRNPIVMEEEADVDRWLNALPELADYITVPGDSELAAVTNRDFYRAMEEYLADQGLTKWEAAEDAMDTLKAMGYDGINHVGGMARGKGETIHDVWIAFDPEQVKSATDNIGTYDPNDPDIRYSISADDEDYKAAVESGDTETAQRMTDEAARNAGYTIKVYHGTPTQMTSDTRGSDLTDAEYESLPTEYADKIFPFTIFRPNSYHSGIYTATDREVAEEFSFNFSRDGTVYDLYAKAENPLQIDAGGRGWNDLPSEVLEQIGLTEAEARTLRSFEMYDRQNPAYYIDDIVEYAKKNGYDAVIVENVRETGMGDEFSPITTDVVVFDPSQLKSADPVVYDDAGELIPLSQRFNSGEDDIRYSLSEAGNRPISEEDEETRKHRYDYDTLVGKGSVKVVQMTKQTIPTKKKQVNTSPIAKAALQNAETITSRGMTQRYVYIDDIGRNVLVNSDGVVHGIRGRITNSSAMSTAQVSYYLPEILRNSIAVNELDPRTESDGKYSQILFGYAADEQGNEYLVKSTLHHFDQNKSLVDNIEIYDVLKGIKAKKTDARVIGSYDANAPANTRNAVASELSIAQLLDHVKDYHPEFLSEDVRRHYGLGDEGRAEGLRYSLSEEQGAIANLPSSRARDEAVRIEGRLAASMARIFGLNTNHTSGEFRQFRAEVVRPIIDAMIEGREDIDPDAIFAEHWNGDLLAGQQARDEFDDAMTQAWRSVQQLNTFAERQRQETAAREQRNAAIDARIPQDTEGIIRLGENLKHARRERQRVLGRLLLTPDDMDLVRASAAGQISDAELAARRPFNYQDILDAAAAERAFREQDEAWGRYTRRLSERRIETADRLLEDADKWKDKGNGLAYARETAERNFRDVMGSDAAAMIDEYIRPVHRSEAASTRFKNDYIRRVKDLKLDQKARRGNAVSEAAAVQWLGEAEDNVRYLQTMRNPDAVRDGQNLSEWLSAIEQFRAENPNLDYNKVYLGIREFSKIYDELITEMNRVLVENGYLPVNVRRGYFPHFNGGDDGILAKFASLLGINIDTNALPTAINGLTSGFKPGKAWFGHAQERTGFRTDYDAVQGFDGYIGGVSDVIHQTANIRNLRTLASRIRYQFSDEGIKNRIDEIMADESRTVEEREAAIRDLTENGRYKNARLVNWLDEYTNLLANKKSKYDRGIEDLMGRRVYTWMKNIEGRVAANMIAGNLGSALTNFIPLNQAGAMLGDFSMLRGAFDTMVGRGRKDDFVQQSDFLTNRRGTDPLIQNRADKISEFLSSPMNLIDDFTSEAIVRAAYGKYIRQGMDAESAMQAADEFAAGVMADRSKGAQPTVFGSRNPLMKLFTQFQVEVNNEFSTIFKDIPKGVHIPDRDKKNMVAVAAWTLLRYFVGAYLFNDLYEKIVGRRAALDPIDILNDAVGDLSGKKLNNVFDMISEGVVDDVRRQNPSDVTQELVTNVAEELPFVGGLLGGGRIPISSAFPDFENINKAAFSENWSGAKKAQVIGRELGGSVGTYILPPFAGGWGRKIIQTGENALAGGRYVKDKEGNDQLQYPYYMDKVEDSRTIRGVNRALDFIGLDSLEGPVDDVIGTIQGPVNTVLKSALFGPTATEGGRDWVEGGFGSQSAKNTELYKRLTQDLGEDQRTSFAFISGLTGLDPLGKRVAVAESGLSEEGKAEAMSAVVSESERYKFRAAYENGVSADAWAGFYRTLPRYDEDGNGSYKQAEVTAALDNARIPLSAGEGAAQGLFGGDTETRSLTRAEKAAIWSAYNPKWKTANNPFDASIGDRVVSRIGQMQDEEGE